MKHYILCSGMEIHFGIGRPVLLWSTCLYLAAYSSVSTAQVVNISYTSQGYPDFYLNNQITFTCTASGFTDIGILELRYDGGSVSQSGCLKNIERIWGASGSPVINEVAGIESPSITTDCIAIAKPEGFTLEVKVTITDISVSGKFYCRGFQPGDVGAVPSSEYTIPSIKVPPESFQMSVYPSENITEGVQFSFNCSEPPSQNYTINGMALNTYIPTRADRVGGVTFSCKYPGADHPNWRLIKVLQMRYAPDDLRLTVYPNTSVVEGEEFMFNCTSDNINATFEYYVKDEVVTLPKYTPEKVDRTGFNISCADVEFRDLDSGNDYITLMPIYVPGNLILTIYPNNTSVFEGEEFNFTCTSDDSLAQFEYKLNGKAVTTQSYIPIESDRGGIAINCTDKMRSGRAGTSIGRFFLPIYRAMTSPSTTELDPGTDLVTDRNVSFTGRSSTGTSNPHTDVTSLGTVIVSSDTAATNPDTDITSPATIGASPDENIQEGSDNGGNVDYRPSTIVIVTLSVVNTYIII